MSPVSAAVGIWSTNGAPSTPRMITTRARVWRVDVRATSPSRTSAPPATNQETYVAGDAGEGARQPHPSRRALPEHLTPAAGGSEDQGDGDGANSPDRGRRADVDQDRAADGNLDERPRGRRPGAEREGEAGRPERERGRHLEPLGVDGPAKEQAHRGDRSRDRPGRRARAEAAVFGMRLVSAALAAGFLTWGAARVTSTLGARAATWAIAAAITPMCLFLGGTVNPQGLEVATAFSFWAACLALALGTGAPSTGTFVQVAVSGAVLVNVRASSPVWAVGAVVVALILAPPGRWREVLRQRSARWVGLTGALASIGAVSWLATHPAVTGGGLFPEYADPVS